MGWERFERKSEQPELLWQIRVDGAEVRTRTGRIDGEPIERCQSFDDDDAASRRAEELIELKKSRGYVSLGVILLEAPEPTTLSWNDAAERFERLGTLFHRLRGEFSSVMLYPGDVHTNGAIVDLRADAADEGIGVIIVDGNLTLSAPHTTYGRRDPYDSAILLVTGDLITNALELSDCGHVLVEGTMNAGPVYLHDGWANASLRVAGDIVCEAFLAERGFIVQTDGHLRSDPDAILADATFAGDLPRAYGFAPVPDSLDLERVFARILAGEPILEAGELFDDTR